MNGLTNTNATGYPIFVAVNDAGEVVGWSSLSRYKERFGYRFSTENSIYIHPAVARARASANC